MKLRLRKNNWARGVALICHPPKPSIFFYLMGEPIGNTAENIDQLKTPRGQPQFAQPKVLKLCKSPDMPRLPRSGSRRQNGDLHFEKSTRKTIHARLGWAN